tara:strand:- start:509 stop:715 length:207 start_codon:yes stop_codon:yes gene_type:complete
MKKYEIYYAYGGKYKGEMKYTKTVFAENENEAMVEFHKLWNSEVVYHCKEVSGEHIKPIQQAINKATL